MDARETGELYQRFGGMVLRRARDVLGDTAAAEDVMQEVFARVFRAPERLADLESPVAWLYQMTTRLCLNARRNGSRRDELHALHGVKDEESNAEGGLNARVAVTQLLEGVSESLREIAVYYYLDQMSHEEIASVTGVSRRTVGNRLVELREQLRALHPDMAEGMAP